MERPPHIVSSREVPEQESAYPAPFDLEKLSFVNRGTEECLLLCWGERRPDVDRVTYPDDAEYDRNLQEHRPARHWIR